MRSSHAVQAILPPDLFHALRDRAASEDRSLAAQLRLSLRRDLGISRSPAPRALSRDLHASDGSPAS
jgi:hypothetical protein